MPLSNCCHGITLPKDILLASTFALLTLLTRSTVFIFTPLYLDALSSTTAVQLNLSSPNENLSFIPFPNSTGRPAYEQIDPLCAIIFSMGFDTVVIGVMLLVTRIFWPQKVTERETKYPKKGFFIAGGTQAMSSLIFLYACSGSRTAPYLQAVLGNFHIPITFSLRFLLLRKRPTLRKLLCAAAVASAEIMTLIPTIFPALENEGDHAREGGASGIGRILWPFCFVASMVPAALSNIAQEVIYKEEKKLAERDSEGSQANDEGEKKKKINMVYALFWTYFFIFCSCVLGFWTDLIPGFGTTTNFPLFLKLIKFNFGCLFGVGEVCVFPVWFLAWGRMASKTLNVLVSAFLLRYGEGANFLVIILAMRTPVVFLFWTMFEEHPFRWNPEAHLSTWLSIAAIFIMIPAMIIYQTGAPEKTVPKPMTREVGGDEDERRPLLDPAAASIQSYSRTEIQDSQSVLGHTGGLVHHVQVEERS